MWYTMGNRAFPMSQKLVLLLGDMGIVVSVYLFVTTVILTYIKECFPYRLS